LLHYVLVMDRLRWADGREFLVRVVGPALILCGLILGLGFVLAGPLAPTLDAEDAVNRGLAASRTTPWNTITFVWSYIGSTETIVGVCLLVSLLVLWRTRDWRLAAVPPIAVLLQLSIYLVITGLVARARPDVDPLDVLPRMTSYPSGHVGATTALYLSFILLASRIEHPALRRVTIVLCLIPPVLVGFARLYRGMHHLTDIAAGMLVGAACALLAYGWYRHRLRDRPPQENVNDLTSTTRSNRSRR
jgi:membrane-associated phospholipid phosphatase